MVGGMFDSAYSTLNKLFWVGLALVSIMWFGIGWHMGSSNAEKLNAPVTEAVADSIIAENCEESTRSVELLSDDDPRNVHVGQYRVAQWYTKDPFKKTETNVVEILAIQDDYVKYRYEVGTDDSRLVGRTNSTDLNSFIRVYGTILK